MAANPYDNPEFALQYAAAQADVVKNRYEWQVTHPALLQFLGDSPDTILDYGCGTGIFTAAMALEADAHSRTAGLEVIGTDASASILTYASLLEGKVDGLRFAQWDAARQETPLNRQDFNRIFAKLVFNYVAPNDLRTTVLPRLRESLSDDGLLVAVLPNPYREVGYSRKAYDEKTDLSINVGNFSADAPIASYHRRAEAIMESAAGAGFEYGRVLGLPDVRFEPYKGRLMKIARPMPMILDTLNEAKRWVYVFGATDSSLDAFDSSVARFEAWRSYTYPEIADRAHIRTLDKVGDSVMPTQGSYEALYDYTAPSVRHVVALRETYAENLTPRQKIKLSKHLARLGIRDNVDPRAFLTLE